MSDIVEPRLTANFKELGVYGKNPGRETRALESNVKDALKRTEGFINDVIARAVGIIGNRSAFLVQPARDGNFQLLGGKGVVPVNLVDTTFPTAVVLPRRAPNLVCIVKDATGNASAQPIAVTTFEDLANIDGSPSGDSIDVDYACRWYVCDADGTDWWKVVPGA